jgi:hypothetical protein
MAEQDQPGEAANGRLGGPPRMLPMRYSYNLPIGMQLWMRLRGMYLQQIIDFNHQWETDAQTWRDGEYSGDVTDSQPARDLKLTSLQNLDDPSNLEITLITITTSDAHKVYETFDYSCKCFSHCLEHAHLFTTHFSM